MVRAVASERGVRVKRELVKGLRTDVEQCVSEARMLASGSRQVVGVSHHQNDLLRKRSRDGSSVQAYSYGVPGDCLRRADASFTPMHEV